MTVIENCGSCIYSGQATRQPRMLVCRLSPPVLLVNSDRSLITRRNWGQPIVDETDWCGKYKAI